MSEVDIVLAFLGNLKEKGISDIPFRDKDYFNGMRGINHYIRENNIKDFGTLFVNDGLYFSNICMNMMSLGYVSTDYERLYLNISEEMLKHISKRNKVNEFILNQIVDVFLKEVGLSVY